MTITRLACTTCLVLIATMTASFAQINILTPNGGEVYTTGDIVPVIWQSPHPTDPVRIEYTLDEGLTWNVVKESVTGSSLLWKLPELEIGADVKLRITPIATPTNETRFVAMFSNHSSGVNSVDVSPDGKFIAAGGVDGSVSVKRATAPYVEVWRTDQHSGNVILVRYSPDGTIIASASNDGSTILWDAATGRVIRTLSADKGPNWTSGFSPDGTMLVSGYNNGDIRIWNVATGASIKTIKIGSSAVRYVQFGNDSNTVLTANADGSGKMVNINTGTVTKKFDHGGVVNGIDLTSDGKYVVTAGYDGNVKIWRVSTGDLVTTKNFHAGSEASEVRISADGRLGSVGYNGSAVVGNPETGTQQIGILTGAKAPRFSFTPDSRLMIIAHANDQISIWDVVNTEAVMSAGKWRIEVCDNGNFSSIETIQRDIPDQIDLD